MFAIEKNIPITNGGKSAPRKYPFREMKKGDSFFVPAEKESARQALIACAKHAGVKIKTAKVDGGFRCWRIA